MFDYEGKTAEEFIEELEAENFYYYGIRTESDEGGDLSWKISKVTMHFPTWDENGKMAEGADPLDFVNGDDRIRVYFDIVVREPEKETPSNRSNGNNSTSSANDSSESYSASSAGYDNSGSYSAPSSRYDNNRSRVASSFSDGNNFDDIGSNEYSTGEVSEKSAKSKNESSDNNKNSSFDESGPVYMMERNAFD